MNTSAGQLIMLVDDDQTIIETLDFNLKRHGYRVAAFSTGQKALAELNSVNPNLIVLDWMLPDMQGPEICRIIRTRASDVPILMLTGRSAPQDEAEGLHSGADDYLSKPFSAVVLIARVQALLRRVASGSSKDAGKIVIGDVELDSDARKVVCKGKNVDLSPKEFMLLKTMMANAGKTLSTEQLLNQVWGYDFSGDAKTVAVHMRWLRQKLEADPKRPAMLETVHRSGYRFNLPG